MAHSLELLAEKYSQVIENLNGEAEGHDETDMSNPEERTEVHIANEILKATDMKQVKSLAEELLKMHGQKASDDDPLYPPYGGHNKE